MTSEGMQTINQLHYSPMFRFQILVNGLESRNAPHDEYFLSDGFEAKASSTKLADRSELHTGFGELERGLMVLAEVQDAPIGRSSSFS